MTEDLVLELRGVSRQFGAVRALTDVSFDCRAGEIHALVGENGSGKSTLLGIASGFVDPDLGTVQIGGQPLRRDSPAEARKLGLAMAYQDTSLILAQPVKNNLYLAAPPDQRPPFWRRKRWARRVLAEFDLDLELFPDAPAGFLTLADRQLFEVAKALVTDPKVLLLDEPTTALGPRRGGGASPDRRRLSGTRRRRRVREPSSARGPGDRGPDHGPSRRSEPGHVRRQRDHRVVVGRADRRPPVRGGVPTTGRRRPASRARCSSSTVSRASRSGPSASRWSAGEIVGIAGAEGNGQPQLFDCLAGRQPPRAGRVVCDGKELMLISTHEAVRSGIMLLPGDRKHEALMPVLGVRVNATVQTLRRFSVLGFLRRRQERKTVEELVERLEIRTPSLEQPVEFLSGGNQQKVAVSRSFLREPTVILAYEPTQGVDVGSRFDIYAALRSRTDAGTAMLVKSSDPLELAGLCDRVLVMSRGQIIEEIPGDELDELRIVEAIVRGPGLSKAGRSPLGVAMPEGPSPQSTT